MNQDEMTMPRCDIAELQGTLDIIVRLLLARCPEYEHWIKANWPELWQRWKANLSTKSV